MQEGLGVGYSNFMPRRVVKPLSEGYTRARQDGSKEDRSWIQDGDGNIWLELPRSQGWNNTVHFMLVKTRVP